MSKLVKYTLLGFLLLTSLESAGQQDGIIFDRSNPAKSDISAVELKVGKVYKCFTEDKGNLLAKYMGADEEKLLFRKRKSEISLDIDEIIKIRGPRVKPWVKITLITTSVVLLYLVFRRTFVFF
jgi:hypothetical protein